MIEQSDYQMAWQAYLGCGFLASVIWFFMLRRLGAFFLRYWLLLAGVLFLFTPARHPVLPEVWVPANVGAVLGLMTDGVETAMPLLLILIAGQILALVLAVALYFWLGKGAPRDPQQAPAPSRKNTARARIEPAIGVEDKG